MSPGQPQPSGQPHATSQPLDHGAEMANELQLLRTEMENMRLARENDSSELRRLWDINQSNEQALKRAELAYKEEVRRRQALETKAVHASQRTQPAAPSGLASSRHAPPALGEPGPSNWQGMHRPAGPFPTQTTVSNPQRPAPTTHPHFQPAPTTHPHFQPPQWTLPATAPGNPNTELLTELARLQTLFAANQHAVNEQLLNRLQATQNTARLPALKASDIGLFEPVSQPDPATAILFIDNINDAVKQYGAERVLLVLKRCCNNAVVLSWLTSLDEADRNELLVSIPAWERLLRRDFMPKRSTLEHNARSETFKWSQSRTPSQYVSDTIKLLRIAGIVDPDSVVYEVHRGFDRCPELQIPLIQAVKEPGNDISHYRGEVLKYQDMAKLQYKFNTRSRAADSSMAPVYYTSSISSQQSTPHRCKSRCSDGFFGTRRMNDNSKRLSTPKPSECRYCGEEFLSRSRLHTHLRATSHHQRLPSPHRPSPTIPGEQYHHAFFASQTATGTGVEKEGIKMGYEGVTLKERGYPRSRPASDSDRDDAGLTSAFTAELPTVPSPHCSSVTLAEPETSTTVPSPHCSSVTLAEPETYTTVPSPHCSSVTLAETETPTTVPSPQCSSVTLAETKTSTTRTSVPLPRQLPVRFSAIPPATSAAPRLPAPPPATRRLAALELRFASLLMGRAMIRRRITRQLIHWQVRPERLKRRHGMLGIRMFRFCGIQVSS
jgi:hypothetical protein